MHLDRELEELGELYAGGMWIVLGVLLFYYVLGTCASRLT